MPFRKPLLLVFGSRLGFGRDTITRLQKTDRALVSSLQRDLLLAERIKRLRTVPGVGPITALTWALEMGDISPDSWTPQTSQKPTSGPCRWESAVAHDF